MAQRQHPHFTLWQIQLTGSFVVVVHRVQVISRGGGRLDSHDELDSHSPVQASSRGGRWCWTLKSWTCLLLHLFLNSRATDTVFVTLLRTAVETAIAEYTSCYTMRRPHCLSIAVVLAVVHGLLGILGVGLRRRATHSFSPPPFPIKPSRFCGRKATCLLTVV